MTKEKSVGEPTDVPNNIGVVTKKKEDIYKTVEVNKVPVYHCRQPMTPTTPRGAEKIALREPLPEKMRNTGTTVYTDVGKIMIIECTSPHIGCAYKTGEAYDGVVITDRTV